METSEFIQDELERVKQGISRVITGLSPYELMWRPGVESNSIGLILFHLARSEDGFVQGRILNQLQIWEVEKWYQKLNMSVSDTGSSYTPEQIITFPVLTLEDLMNYAEAVRVRTLQYLKGKNNADFDKIINMPRRGDTTIGAVFSLIVVHLAQHIGDIAYIRGMQRGLNK
ncbi:MAG: DinB family protein [Chloroflexi bacterium]|nr:DinB family protein [Chloroflexota bacterium]